VRFINGLIKTETSSNPLNLPHFKPKPRKRKVIEQLVSMDQLYAIKQQNLHNHLERDNCNSKDKVVDEVSLFDTVFRWDNILGFVKID